MRRLTPLDRHVDHAELDVRAQRIAARGHANARRYVAPSSERARCRHAVERAIKETLRRGGADNQACWKRLQGTVLSRSAERPGPKCCRIAPKGGPASRCDSLALHSPRACFAEAPFSRHHPLPHDGRRAQTLPRIRHRRHARRRHTVQADQAPLQPGNVRVGRWGRRSFFLFSNHPRSSPPSTTC